jgi:hypothetical protein
VRYSLAARVDATADDEMPGLHLSLGIDLAQEIVGLRALKCDGPQAPARSQARILDSDHRQNPQSLSKRTTGFSTPTM